MTAKLFGFNGKITEIPPENAVRVFSASEKNFLHFSRGEKFKNLSRRFRSRPRPEKNKAMGEAGGGGRALIFRAGSEENKPGHMEVTRRLLSRRFQILC